MIIRGKLPPQLLEIDFLTIQNYLQGQSKKAQQTKTCLKLTVTMLQKTPLNIAYQVYEFLLTFEILFFTLPYKMVLKVSTDLQDLFSQLLIMNKFSIPILWTFSICIFIFLSKMISVNTRFLNSYK